ncbi:MAG TPA: hypothetical protein VMW13_02210 [Dehalococcoidales bacterium]|nr:hypothetical protein [Dehalococcoidales bacterium]
MVKVILAVVLIACLVLSACQTILPTPLLEVVDQSTEDAIITFRVVIDKPGWLVLRPTTPAGGPDTSAEIARAYLPEQGEYASIDMAVGGAVVIDTDVIAMLYYDDPVDEAFTFSPGGEGDPVVMVEEEVVMVSFTMQGLSPYIEVDNTDAGSGTVIIKACIDKPGWLVLHTLTLEGEPDTSSVLATTPLAAAGVYPGFEVTLSATPARSYYAVLYYDDPADDEFTYIAGGTEDPPVKVDGSTVEEVFTVGE